MNEGASRETFPVQRQLLDELKKIDRPGSFCASGHLPTMFPGLEVKDIGPIALPLGEGQAAVLKKRSRQAPYGKGTQTLVDTDVRRVWEIDAEQVVLANPQWSTIVEQAVRAVQSELGLEQHQLDAHLYKLLLYEPGGFFLSHRDGEKLDRMVATLVIALPSFHEGGELIVRHEGREATIDFGPESQFQTQFAAFYADCEHEIRPVTNGFRLTLVYNLTLEKSKQAITAPTNREHIAAVADILSQWNCPGRTVLDSKADSSGLKLAVLLDHQYTQAGLTYDALKGTDRAKADVLFAAAGQAACDASLALVTHWVSGAAEPSGGYRRYRYDYHHYDRGPHEMGEVFDESLTAKHFSDVNGIPLAFGEIPLNDAEIVSETPLNDQEPDDEDFEGYTGNAGMTLQRWYHRAAIMLWPTVFRFDVLCAVGAEAAVGGLEPMVKQWSKAKKREQAALKQLCFEFANRIIANWPERQSARRYYSSTANASSTTSLLSLLETLGDASLISAWINRVLAKDASVDPSKELGDICQRHGWLTFENELRNLVEHSPTRRLNAMPG